MLTHFLPIMESAGKRFKKRSLVRAKKAEPGLHVITMTSDGFETQNTAEKGDWLVENQTSAKERYLVKAETFEKKYTLMDSLGNGWGCYRPKGEVYALEVTKAELEKLGAKDSLEFQAPWKETIIVKSGDFLVIPLEKNEIYRIARKEFTQTYEQIKE
ncbi:hypothetical protein [Algoriphagus lacus]|nr:hypothetical protein [Algoriphagus lacus]